jgi:speckle-type POZ protein
MSSNHPESAICGSGATSTISAEVVTGWHVLKVEGYSHLKGHGVSNYIKTAALSVEGYSSCILLYPDGLTFQFRDRVAVDLFHLDEIPKPTNNAVKARFKFSLLDLAGEPVRKHTITSGPIWYSFTSADMVSRVYDRSLLNMTDLESSFLTNDSFQVRCDVTVLQKIPTKVITSESPVVVPPTGLQVFNGSMAISLLAR